MSIRADEDGVVARRRARGDSSSDVGGDPVGLLRTGRDRLDPDRRRIDVVALCPEPLGQTGPDLEAVRVVEADEVVRGIEDRRERAVVPPQHHGPSARVVRLELEDVLDSRTAERVDGLVIVADDRDVAMRLGEQRHQRRLCPVRVLELVHQHVPESPGDRLSRGRRATDQPKRQGDLVPEIDEAVCRQEFLVPGVGTRQLRLPTSVFRQGLGRIGLGRVGRRLGQSDRLSPEPGCVPGEGRWRDVLVLAPAEQRHQRGQEAVRIAERPVGVEVELEQVLPQEDDGLGAGQHPNVGRQSELERVLADQPIAERMEREDRRVRVAVRDQSVDADRHLVGGLVREGERQDLRGLRSPRRR